METNQPNHSIIPAPPQTSGNHTRPCQDCQRLLPSDAFTQIRHGGAWIQTEDCPHCSQQHRDAIAKRQRIERLDHYRQEIPAKYRPQKSGGETNLSHPDWVSNNLDLQLKHFQKWNREQAKPWAGVIGPGGNLKSRLIGVFARQLALEGRRLLWIKAGALPWIHSARFGYNSRDHDGTASRGWEALKLIEAADILILDDIWKSHTPKSLHTLFRVLEDRYSNSRPLLWTANTHPSSLHEVIEGNISTDLHQPLIGRLIEASSFYDLTPTA